MKKINTLLIGVGAHSKRIYLPFAKSNEVCNLVACFDLESQKIKIEDFLKKNEISVKCYYTKNYKISDIINGSDLKCLNAIIKRHKVVAVIISTEPLAHFKYIKWALSNNLHILLDKPITTEVDVSINVNKAKKLYRDYNKLAYLYTKKNKKQHLVFSLQAQRRFHVGFLAARKMIIEMAKISSCPVTSIQTFHSDGQWTFPNEFISQTYHPYNQGYGKMSHSGFHSLDIAIWLADASLVPNKKWNKYRLQTSFIRPKDVLAQFSKEDYLKFFPEIKWDLNLEKQLDKITGEVDAFTNISLLRDNDIITSINCNSLHNSFSRRGWSSSNGKDLYKGNGRVRQESYIIDQGPFQSIIINSFQCEEIQKENLPLYGVGGEYHFDIHIFRNKTLFPQLKAYEFLNLQSLCAIKDFGYSRGHQEDARRNCIVNFYQSIINKTPPENQGTNILYHRLTTQILSSIYISASRQFIGQNCSVEEHIDPIFHVKSYIKRLPIIVQSIVYRIKKANKFEALLLKRTDVRGGFWNVVNGTIEINESVTECRARELYEEAGIKEVVSWSDEIYRFTFIYHNETFSVFVFAAQVSSEQEVVINEEHVEYKWVDFNTALKMLKFEDDKIALKKCKKMLMMNKYNEKRK